MKKNYRRPEVEFVSFVSKDAITNGLPDIGGDVEFDSTLED